MANIPTLKNANEVEQYFLDFTNVDELTLFKLKVIPYFVKYSRAALMQFAEKHDIDPIDLSSGIKKYVMKEVKKRGKESK